MTGGTGNERAVWNGVNRVLYTSLVLMWAFVVSVLATNPMPNAAAGDPVSDFASGNLPLIVVVTVITGGAAVFIKGLGSKNRTILGVIALTGVGLSFLSFFNGGGGTNYCATHPEDPACKDAAPIAWNTRLTATLP